MSWLCPLARLRVAPRVAIALIVTILAGGLMENVLRSVLPPVPQLVVERNWLSDAIQEAARIASDTPPHGRLAALSRLESAKVFNFDLQRHMPIAALPGPFEYGPHGPQVILLARHMGDDPVEDAIASRMLTNLQIGVQLADGSWLIIREKGHPSMSGRYAFYLAGIAVRVLLIVLFSYFMARSILRPLTRLSAAAERMGRDREPTLITGMNAPEYAAIAETFNEMQLRLKRHVDERTQMLAAISHDLRTPLTRLRLLAEYVPEAQRDRLQADIADMETMLSDTLAFAGGEMRREAEEVTDIAALLISLTDNFADAGDVVVYEGPDHLALPCRPMAMKRAFANLIVNGCRYGEAVRVRLSVDRSRITIDFIDRGSGIPAGEAERAFQPFERLEDSRNRESGGTGLGLAIAREAIRGQGGDISFLNDPAGFTVRVLSPAAKLVA